jgi:hypothetical protein
MRVSGNVIRCLLSISVITLLVLAHLLLPVAIVHTPVFILPAYTTAALLVFGLNPSIAKLLSQRSLWIDDLEDPDATDEVSKRRYQVIYLYTASVCLAIAVGLIANVLIWKVVYAFEQVSWAEVIGNIGGISAAFSQASDVIKRVVLGFLYWNKRSKETSDALVYNDGETEMTNP